MEENEALVELTPREYQTEIMKKALQENIIIYLPTGAGKTYIATLLIKCMCAKIKKPFTEGGQRTFFLVNTVQLVEQQASAIQQATPLRVGQFSGDRGVDNWGKDEWTRQFDGNEILVMTAQIFENILTANFIKLENVNVLVLDECHRAVQAHPMRQIMSHFEHCPPEKQPRVLGLSATLINGNCKPRDVDDQITHLERTLHAKIVSHIDDEQVLRFSTNPIEHIEVYGNFEKTSLSNYLDNRLKKLNEKISRVQFEMFMQNIETPKDYTLLNSKEDKPRKDLRSILGDLSLCLEDMNVFGLYVGTLAQIIRLERMKLNTSDGFLYNILNVCVTELILIRKIISDHIDEKNYAQVIRHLSPKVLKTLELLKEAHNNSILIFVTRRFTAKVLSSLIKDFIAEANPELYKNVHCDFVIGATNSNLLATNENVFARKVNSDVVEKFYKKKLNVLIATDVLEEGTDIPLCNIVVKYDLPLTFRSYIQSKGRARSQKSHFYVLVAEGEEADKFRSQHFIYSRIEDNLKQVLLSGREKPSGEEIEQDLYQDQELPPFSPLGPGGPTVTMVGAPSLVNRYVQSLPQDKFTVMIPLYFWKHDLNTNMHTVQIQLPSNSPIKTRIEGPPMSCPKSAKQAACLELCKNLYNLKELNDNLLPRGSKSAYLEDPNWFPNWEDEEVKKGVAEPGTSKNIRMHEKKFSTTLEDCQPEVNSPVFLHVFEIKPTFELSKEENRQRRLYYFSLLKKPNTFGILTNKPIPQICDFPLFISLGELEVKMRMNIPLEPLNHSQVEKLHKFHCLLFMQVLDVVKSFMVSNKIDTPANSSYMVCPVYPTSNSDPLSYVIDWKAIDTYQEKFVEVHEVSDKTRKGMSFNWESLEGSLIVPWYRGYNISKQCYIVTRIAKELNPSSQFPSTEYHTYSEYFKDKYSKTIYHEDQYLIDVYPVNSKLNCLVPRLRTGKRKKQDPDREHMEETLVPELCVGIKFPTVYWIKAIFLPSALHRLNRLMISEELRLKIVSDVKLGSEFIPLDQVAPLTANKINVESLPNMEAPVSPVSTVTNSFERSVMEWKTAKQTNQYPWLEHELPADIDRNMNKVSIIDIKNYESFMSQTCSNSKSSAYDSAADTYQSPKVHSSLSKWKPSFKEPPRLSVLENNANNFGPQQSEIFQCITALSAHDIQNYEYLETLGDSFLKFAVSLTLFLYCDNIDEGKLTRLKGKLVGNRNLYYCAKRMELASLLEVYAFSPSDDWIPPRFGVETSVRDVMREAELPPEGLFQVNFTEEEKMTGVLTDESLDKIEAQLVALSVAAESEEEPRGRSSTSILYLNRQEVPDKWVADCVEALLGVYVKKCGIKDAFKMLLYFGILPDSIIRYNLVFEETFVPEVCINKAADSPEQVQFLLEESCYEILEKQIGYTFNDKKYILQALSHTSFTSNLITECYQRLEFLGDAILDFLITCFIYETGKELSPGQVTDVRSACVNNVTFACLAVRYGMHKSLLYRSVTLRNEINKFASLQESKNHRIGEEVLILMAEADCKGAEAVDVPKVLGDVFESIAGAIYLDSGKDLKTVWRVYYNLMHRELHEFVAKPPKNIVRKLYELNIDAKFFPPESVPDVDDIVMVPLEVRLNNKMEIVWGFGRNKSAAKKAAAKAATIHLTNADA